jgi:hypothetical protein
MKVENVEDRDVLVIFSERECAFLGMVAGLVLAVVIQAMVALA